MVHPEIKDVCNVNKVSTEWFWELFLGLWLSPFVSTMLFLYLRLQIMNLEVKRLLINSSTFCSYRYVEQEDLFEPKDKDKRIKIMKR